MKKIYKREWSKFKQHYKTIFFGLLITMMTVSFLSYWWAVSHPNQTKEGIEFIIDAISDKGFEEVMGEEDEQTENGVKLSTNTKHKMFWLIFKNNLIAVSAISLAGAFSYFILPYLYGMLSIVINSTLIGIVLAFEKITGGSAIKALVFSIMPHGITEFTAILLAATLCTYTGNKMFVALFQLIGLKSKEKTDKERNSHYIKEMKETLKNGFFTYLTVIVPLVLISAIIESYVTIHVMNQFL